MRRLLLLGVCGMLLAGSGVLAQEREREQAQAIRQITEDFSAAWNAHDPERLAALCAENATLINPMGRHARGRGEIEQLFREEHETFLRDTRWQAEIDSIHTVRDDLAVMDGVATVTGLRSPEGEQLPVQRHQFTTVVIREDERWLIAAVRTGPLEPADEE